MRFLKLLVALAAVVSIHLAAAWLWTDFPRTVDLFVVLVVLQALGASSLSGTLGGMVAGLAHDILTGGPYGLYGFADTIVGYLTARTAQRLIIDRASRVMAVVTVATLVQQAIIAALAALLLDGATSPTLGWWGIKALATGAVATVAHGAVEVLRGTRARRSRDRRSRLRLGK